MDVVDTSGRNLLCEGVAASQGACSEHCADTWTKSYQSSDEVLHCCWRLSLGESRHVEYRHCLGMVRAAIS